MNNLGGNETLADKRVMVFEKYAPNNFWYRYRNKLIEYYLKRYTKTNDFLDIGCGNGIVIKHLRKNNDLRISGCDINLKALYYARRRNNKIYLFQYDLLKDTLERSYDTIGCFDVLEHINDDVKAIKSLYDLVRPDGYLLLTVPIDMKLWGMNDVVNEHKRRYNEERILRLVKDAGFQIVAWNRFTFLLYPILRIVRYLQKEKTDILIDELDEVSLRSFLNLNQGKVLNEILYWIYLFEFILIKVGIRLPKGGSVIILAKK
ncbi:MAG: class I SAM-dependent methyltransferase [Candidatus Nitrosotenuis sp.]